MNKLSEMSLFFFLLLSLPGITTEAGAKTKETPHYDVVAEFVRSLGAVNRIQQTAQREFQEEDNPDNPFSKLLVGIRSSTRFKLELTTSINTFKQMKLNKPFETLLPTMIEFYKQKYQLFDEMSRISTQFLKGPKAGGDYSKELARMPEITAQVEYIDESIFQATVLIFAILIDQKPDSKGHMSHLIITVAQRQKLLDDIYALFGESLDKKNKNWTVSSAALLKAYLLKDYKCKDEWQNEGTASKKEQ